MPVSCSIYEADTPIDMSAMETKLSGYSHSSSHPELQEDLLTTVEDVSGTSYGVECTIFYDRPLQLGVRPGENPWVKNTVQSEVRFCRNIGSDGFLIIGPKSKRSQTVAEVATILNSHPNNCELKEIPSTSITAVVAQDSVDSTFGWWEDIDASTSSGSVTGDIANSTHARDFDNQGDPLWVIFISDYADLKVGISRDSVVFYGNGWSEAEMEEYIYQIVLPNL